jgi:hypothetical protein
MKRSTIGITGGTLVAAAVIAGLTAGSAQANTARPEASITETPARTATTPTPTDDVADTDADPAETDMPIKGDALARASTAALAHTRAGAVTETEVGDEEGFYEVEVTLADGSQVDVHLTETFTVLGSVSDHEGGS